jgi:hypothetical protein
VPTSAPTPADDRTNQDPAPVAARPTSRAGGPLATAPLADEPTPPVEPFPTQGGTPPDPSSGRRTARRAIGAVLVAALAIAAIGSGWAYLRDRDDAPEQAAPTVSTDDADEVAEPGEDPRAELVRGFCDDPRALGDEMAEFVPGQGAVAYVQVPQPASSTTPVDNLTVQVAPTVGEPTLELPAAINLVSLAVCTDLTSSEPTTTTCDFELTNPGSIGEEQTAPLAADAYELRLYELRTGEVLAEGELTSAIDRCPELAYLDGDVVANPLPQSEVLTWIAFQSPTLAPS